MNAPQVQRVTEGASSFGAQGAEAPGSFDRLNLPLDTLLLGLVADRCGSRRVELHVAAPGDRLNDLLGQHEADPSLPAQDRDRADLLTHASAGRLRARAAAGKHWAPTNGIQDRQPCHHALPFGRRQHADLTKTALLRTT